MFVKRKIGRTHLWKIFLKIAKEIKIYLLEIIENIYIFRLNSAEKIYKGKLTAKQTLNIKYFLEKINKDDSGLILKITNTRKGSDWFKIEKFFLEKKGIVIENNQIFKKRYIQFLYLENLNYEVIKWVLNKILLNVEVGGIIFVNNYWSNSGAKMALNELICLGNFIILNKKNNGLLLQKTR
jgi:hypothetical protein